MLNNYYFNKSCQHYLEKQKAIAQIYAITQDKTYSKIIKECEDTCYHYLISTTLPNNVCPTYEVILDLILKGIHKDDIIPLFNRLIQPKIHNLQQYYKMLGVIK